MIIRLKSLILLLLLSNFLFAQTPASSPSDNPPEKKEKTNTEFIFKPTIGLGTGMFSFYGDLYTKHFQAPMMSRIGYDLNISQHFTDYLQFNFYVLFGKLGADERYVTDNNRNLNFESQIRVGGINVLYDFGHFLPKDRTATPFVTLGIESFEFLSKTDLYDAHGNRYHYWSDGSIRNIDENAPNAATATVIHRDYTYETDIREMNLDGFGKYPERSWAIPVGAGVMFKINDYFTFKMGATMHFTFTDYIDGVTSKSTGIRAGNSQNDKFMMTSFSLHYNLGLKNGEEALEEDAYGDVDFLALDQEDQDQDGVADLIDSCQGTPAGVPVDAKGCPIDDDDDGVPNYKDDEINSPAGAFVDSKGVQLTDSLIAYQYNFYMDSTGAFAKVEVHDHNGNSMSSLNQKEYSVELGTFKKGLTPEIMTKFLSVSDIASNSIDDSTTIYTAGKFNNLLDAEKRKRELISDGLTDAKVIYKQNGKYHDAPAAFTSSTPTDTNLSSTNKDQSDKNKDLAINNTGKTDEKTDNRTDDKKDGSIKNNKDGSSNTSVKTKNKKQGNGNAQPPMDNLASMQGVVYRVQLGAYSRRISKNVFKNADNVIEVQTDDGLYKYMSGSFTQFDRAAKHKVELLLKGYQGAFITAYKDGKRVPLKDIGVTTANKKDKLMNEEKAGGGVDKKLIVFKVQLGSYKNDPPADKQAKIDKVKGVTKEPAPGGLTRYIVGSFNDYNAAEAFKNDIVKNNDIEGAFVIAFFNGEYISVQEALELMK